MAARDRTSDATRTNRSRADRTTSGRETASETELLTQLARNAAADGTTSGCGTASETELLTQLGRSAAALTEPHRDTKLPARQNS